MKKPKTVRPKEKLQAYNDVYYRSLKGRFTTLKEVARRKNKECAITYDEYCLIVSNPCHYCKGNFGRIEDFPRSYFVDRKDNNLNYTIDNCIPCCPLCNKIKMDNLTHEETEDAVNGILSGKVRRANEKTEAC